MTLYKKGTCKQKVKMSKKMCRCECGHVDVFSGKENLTCPLCGSTMVEISAKDEAEE